MRSHVFLLALVLVAGSFALPYLAHAAIPFFGPIIPDGINTCPLGWGAVIIVINNIIEFLLTIAIVFVAPIMIAYSGFLFVVNPVNPAGKEKAKGILLNTIVGIVIALAAWLIVGAVMAALYHPDPSKGFAQNWYDIINSGDLPACLLQTGAVPSAPVGTPPAGVAVAPTPTPTVVVTPQPASGTLQCTTSHTNNLQILTASGIRVSSTGNCCDQNNRSCTSLTAIKASTISQVKEIQRACGSVTVTGGTETGHSTLLGISHSGGSKIDLAPNISSCITRYTTAAGTRSDGATVRKDRCGNSYARESTPDHWDITVTAVCSLI